MITKDLAGRTLTGLGAAHDRIAATMYTVDTHPAWSLLRGGLVTGETQRRGQALQTEVDRLWACFAALGEQLERARALNAPRKLAEPALADLTALLTTAVVTLDVHGLPVDPAGAVAHRLTLDQLAGQTEQSGATVLAQLSDVDTAWAAVAGEYVRASAELDAVAALAAEVGDPDAAGPARAAAAEVERLDLHDPVTAAAGGVLAAATRTRIAALREQVSTTRRGLDALVAARDGYPDRRAALVALIDRVAAAEAGTAEAYARVMEKIVEPGLAPVPTATAVLRARLAELDQCRAQSRWRRLADDLSTVEQEAARARDRADELTGIADGLLARRDELRGRLAAYRAKAVALGFAEEAGLTALHTSAHDLLFTAPCDLRAATKAVYAYARGLAGPAGRATEEDDR